VKTVAATGGTAEMVEMLKNDSQKIVATSSEQKSGLFYSLFSAKDAGLKTAVAVDNNEYKILLNARVKPQVVFYTDGAYDESQLKTLRSNHIYPVALYDCTEGNEDDSTSEGALTQLLQNTQIVAKVLGGDASSYINYCKTAANEIKSNCKGDGYWYQNRNATFVWANYIGYVSGLELVRDTSQTRSNNYYYRSSPISVAGYYLMSDYSAFMCYYCECERSFINARQPEYMIFSNWLIKTKLENYMKIYATIPGSELCTEKYPEIRAVVVQPKCMVNPKGACLWIETSPECILESYWLASVVRNYSGGTGDTVEFVKGKISAFYKDFLHVNLTSSQVGEIYNGPQN
jgi:hypothetical protein